MNTSQGVTQGSVGSSMMAGTHDNSKLGGSQGNKPYSEKVDLNDLDWEDRERVLRLLFSKMNAGVPANAARIQMKQMMRSERGASASNLMPGMTLQQQMQMEAYQYEQQDLKEAY